MIEDELRATFARHEDLVPAGEPLLPAIHSGAARRRSRRRWAGAAAGLAVVLLAAVPAMALRDTTAAPVPGAAAPAAEARQLNYLILGTDQAQRPDTIMILSVSPARDRAALVSIPRDLVTDRTPAGTASEVSRLTGLTFDGAFIARFEGLSGVVDAVGGLDLCLEHAIRSLHTGRTYPPGCRHYTGAETVDLARQRYDVPRGDFGRIDNGQQVFKALFAKVGKAGPVQADAALRAAGASLSADLRGRSTAEVFAELARLDPATMVTATAPVEVEPVHGRTRATPETARFFEALRAGTMQAWVIANPPKTVNPVK
ncbi:LCP family protein [Longispora albida]|uniref:LCP family protein n=1 Tax=Longispora albida TaxID=203523 RepID=UPI00036C8D69|nr:LCP family protein [Longispora albida]